MLLRILLSALAFVIVMTGAALAVTVSPIKGDVLVRTGQGFQKIVVPTEFAAGAQVMVSPKGSATIAYTNDCVVSVRPASVTVVQDRPPCGTPFAEPSHFGFEQSALAVRDSYGFTPKVTWKKRRAAKAAPAARHPRHLEKNAALNIRPRFLTKTTTKTIGGRSV